MTRDALRPRLNRLGELAKQLNASSDEIALIVQRVEAYLSENLKLGVWANATLEHEESEDGSYKSTKSLVYGRLGPKFRFYVIDEVYDHGCGNQFDPVPWGNCTREVKISAFNALPNLLDKLIANVQNTLEEIEANKETLDAIVPIREPKKKGVAS